MNHFQSSFYSFKIQERILVKISIASVATVSTQGINSTHKNELRIGKQNFKISRLFFRTHKSFYQNVGYINTRLQLPASHHYLGLLNYCTHSLSYLNKHKLKQHSSFLVSWRMGPFDELYLFIF